MLVCSLVISNLLLIVFWIISFRNVKKQYDDRLEIIEEKQIISLAWYDRYDRKMDNMMKFLESKLGQDLVNKLDEIYKLGENPRNLVLGKDGKLHKVTPGY